MTSPAFSSISLKKNPQETAISCMCAIVVQVEVLLASIKCTFDKITTYHIQRQY